MEQIHDCSFASLWSLILRMLIQQRMSERNLKGPQSTALAAAITLTSLLSGRYFLGQVGWQITVEACLLLQIR